jgi:hypothetical protein
LRDLNPSPTGTKAPSLLVDMMMTNRRRSRYHIKAHSTRERFCFLSESVFILVWHQPVKTLENSVETQAALFGWTMHYGKLPPVSPKLYCAYFFGCMAKRSFVVCLFHGARCKNIRQKNSLSCVFPSAHDKQIVCREFFSWHTANISP